MLSLSELAGSQEWEYMNSCSACVTVPVVSDAVTLTTPTRASLHMAAVSVPVYLVYILL